MTRLVRPGQLNCVHTPGMRFVFYLDNLMDNYMIAKSGHCYRNNHVLIVPVMKKKGDEKFDDVY